MDTIFFSYSRTDSAFVLKLAKDLRDAGIPVWLDQLDIAPGSHWDASIQKALQTSKTLLIILSPHSVASENVMDEVSYALEEGKKVIPILLSDCDTPFRLRRLQRIDFTSDYNTGFNYLLQHIEAKDLQNEPPPANTTKTGKNIQTPVIQKTDPSKKSAKKYFFIGGGVLLLVLLILLVTNMGGPDDQESSASNKTAAEMYKVIEVDTTLYYFIENAADSLLYMGIAKSSMYNNANVVALNYEVDEENNNLKIQFSGKGDYCLRFKHSGKFMYIMPGNNVAQFSMEDVEGPVQYFELLPDNDGYFQIKDPMEETRVLGLDPASEGFEDGQKIISVRNNNSMQTKWRLVSSNEKVVRNISSESLLVSDSISNSR